MLIINWPVKSHRIHRKQVLGARSLPLSPAGDVIPEDCSLEDREGSYRGHAQVKLPCGPLPGKRVSREGDGAWPWAQGLWPTHRSEDRG